jgi:ferredoxin
VRVNFVLKDGSVKSVVGKEGENVLHLARANGIELEGTQGPFAA